MPILRLPLGQWLPDAGENQNPGLLVAKGMFPYAESYVPSGFRMARTATLPGVSVTKDCFGMDVNPNVDSTTETDPVVLGQGTLYYGIENAWNSTIWVRGNGEIWAVPISMPDDALWAPTLVTTTTYNVGAEGWHFASFGATEIAVCGHDEHVLARINGTGNFVKLFDTVADPNTGEPKPKFVAVGDERLIFANIANTGSPGPGGADPDVNLVWWGATDSPGSIGNPVSHPADATDYQVLIDDHGPITGLVGGREFALVFKRSTIYRMDYGGTWGPSFKPIPQAVGTRHSKSIIRVGDVVYFWGPNGPARYVYDRVEDLGKGVFIRALTNEQWIATDPEMRYQDFLEIGDQDNLSTPYSVQVAYSAGSGNVIWTYRRLGGDTMMLVYNHYSERSSILERNSVVDNIGTTGSSYVLAMATVPDTGIDFSPARDVVFMEQERDATTAALYTLGPTGAETHNHDQSLGTGYFTHPEGMPNSFRIDRARPVFTVAKDELAPTPNIVVTSRQYPYDTSPLATTRNAIDRNGWVTFGQLPFRAEHRIQIDFPPHPVASHPARTLAEIEAIDIWWTEGPEL